MGVMNLKLIINGDDFGITHACNLAIIDCHKRGVLTSTSIMMNMPYAQEALELWQHNKTLSVGLHLNITLGYPINKNTNNIVNSDGTFSKEILNYRTTQLNLDEISKECQSQMDKFIKIAGRKPDHINSHHAIECMHGGARVIQELANFYDLPIRQLSNINSDEKVINITNYEVPIKKMLKTPSENIMDIISLFSEEDLKSNTYYELIGHPGYIDYELTKLSSLTIGRCFDTKCFCSSEIKDWIKSNNIELINYTDLPKKYLNTTNH